MSTYTMEQPPTHADLVEKLESGLEYLQQLEEEMCALNGGMLPQSEQDWPPKYKKYLKMWKTWLDWYTNFSAQPALF